VKSVRTEVLGYSYKNGKRQAEKRRVDTIETFDYKGNLLREISYSDDGSILWDEINSYAHGRLVETLQKHSPFMYSPTAFFTDMTLQEMLLN
jgi:hypothetical protein